MSGTRGSNPSTYTAENAVNAAELLVDSAGSAGKECAAEYRVIPPNKQIPRTDPRTVAALYVDPRGPYPKMPNVECWDAERDAENYAGPWPVVAHPPCGPWSRLRHLYRGAGEASLGLVAFAQVRRWGGVLEQPKGSRLFAAAGAATNGYDEDAWGGFTITVDQCDWGHVARKRTWLYMVGVPATALYLFPRHRDPTHWCSGGRTKRPGMGATVPPGIKVCSAQQRRRTPPAFAEWLVELARSVRRTEAA